MAKAEQRGFGELRTELAAGRLGEIYILQGEEDLLRQEAEELIVERALAGGQRDFNLDILHAGEADPADIVARASSFPMMADRRVVLVREADRLRSGDPLVPYFAAPQKHTCLILSAGKLDLRKRPFAGGARGASMFSFPPLPAEDVPDWIVARVRALGRTITPGGASLLAASSGGLLREVGNEIDKLLLYAGDRTAITEADVAGLAGFTREFSIHELQRAIGARDTRRAVTILDRMLEMGESGPGIVFMLTRFFSNLWRLQDLAKREPHMRQWDRTRHVGIWKDEGDPLAASVSAFSTAEIERAFPVLSTTDEQLKSTQIDPRALLAAMVVRLTARHSAAS